jgi:hypothetical protein
MPGSIPGDSLITVKISYTVCNQQQKRLKKNIILKVKYFYTEFKNHGGHLAGSCNIKLTQFVKIINVSFHVISPTVDCHIQFNTAKSVSVLSSFLKSMNFV